MRIVRTRPRELPFGSLTRSLALIAHSHRSRRMQIARRRVLSLRRFIVWLMYASACALVRSGRSRYQPGELSAESDCGDRSSLTFGLAALTLCERSLSAALV